ncbi:MAG: hypothetical protein ABI472_05850 [Ginsengibacter sp.]
MALKLYSKKAISLVALFISPFLSCILFAYNLRDVGKGKAGPLFIIGALVLAGLIQRILPGINPILSLAILNIVGSSLLTYYFWGKFLDDYAYEKRNPWIAIFIFLGIIILTLLVAYLKLKLYDIN